MPTWMRDAQVRGEMIQEESIRSKDILQSHAHRPEVTETMADDASRVLEAFAQ